MSDDIEVRFEAPDDVGELIAAAGRTEDIDFSPSRRRIALAGFYSKRIILLDVSHDASQQSIIRAHRAVDIRCDQFALPHGVRFLDEDLLAVANRAGGLIVLDLGSLPAGSSQVKLRPLAEVPGGEGLHITTPGSLDAIRVDGGFEIIACNNYADRVTCHRLRTGDAPAEFTSHEVMLAGQFEVPDGAAVSADGKLLAISNHHKEWVDVYELPLTGGVATEPVARLLDAGFPHGISFAKQDRYFLVADAGAPAVYVYERGPDGWVGDIQKAGGLQTLSTQEFMRGRSDPAEGGPKGLCVLDDLDLIGLTCEFRQLALYRLGAFIDRAIEEDQFASLQAALQRYSLMPIMRDT